MQSVLLLVVAAIAAGIGATASVLFHSRLARAEKDRAVAEVEARAAAASADQRAAAEAVRAQLDMVRGDLHSSRDTLVTRERELGLVRETIARHETEAAGFVKRIEELANARDQLRETFQALSAEALRGNNETFLQLARSELERARSEARADLDQKQVAIDALVVPIRDGLATYDAKLQQIERERTESFAKLAEQVAGVVSASDRLRSETVNLSKALQSSNTRGAWGELQLKRVCELGGMLEHCDFSTQHSVQSADGLLRPDVVVHLADNRTIVIDAKAPAAAFFEASNCDDPQRQKELLAAHALQVKKHVDGLSKKSYWEQFDDAPDFVVLFLPNEALYSAAVQHEPSLLEYAVAQRVLITTPTSLVGLLKVVALGWRQERIAKSAAEVSALGRDLYDRLRVMSDHFSKLGSHLQKAVDAYNGSVGSIERSVFPQARKFEALGAGAMKPIGELLPIDVVPRALAAPDWIDGGELATSPPLPS
jgi:DNA recombination protein RmuC